MSHKFITHQKFALQCETVTTKSGIARWQSFSTKKKLLKSTWIRQQCQIHIGQHRAPQYLADFIMHFTTFSYPKKYSIRQREHHCNKLQMDQGFWGNSTVQLQQNWNIVNQIPPNSEGLGTSWIDLRLALPIPFWWVLLAHKPFCLNPFGSRKHEVPPWHYGQCISSCSLKTNTTRMSGHNLMSVSPSVRHLHHQ